MKRSFALLFVALACVLASAQTADCAALTHQALELPRAAVQSLRLT